MLIWLGGGRLRGKGILLVCTDFPSSQDNSLGYPFPHPPTLPLLQCSEILRTEPAAELAGLDEKSLWTSLPSVPPSRGVSSRGCLFQGKQNQW